MLPAVLRSRARLWCAAMALGWNPRAARIACSALPMTQTETGSGSLAERSGPVLAYLTTWAAAQTETAY